MPENNSIAVSHPQPGADEKLTQANKIVRKYMLIAVAPGVVPMPLVSLGLLLSIQLSMLYKLARLYEISFSAQLGKSLVGTLIGAAFPTSLRGFVIRNLGPIAGMLSMGIFGGASTYAVGQVFIQHFASGGTMLTFDPNKVSDYYTQQFTDGKRILRENFVGVKP